MLARDIQQNNRIRYTHIVISYQGNSPRQVFIRFVDRLIESTRRRFNVLNRFISEEMLCSRTLCNIQLQAMFRSMVIEIRFFTVCLSNQDSSKSPKPIKKFLNKRKTERKPPEDEYLLRKSRWDDCCGIDRAIGFIVAVGVSDVGCGLLINRYCCFGRRCPDLKSNRSLLYWSQHAPKHSRYTSTCLF